MEEFKEYWERFTEWYLSFVKSRWIRTIVLLGLLVGFIISIVFSVLGSIVQSSWINNNNIKEVYGHRDWAIPALIFSVFGFIWMLIILKNDPNKKHCINFRKFYHPLKLWYWMPTLFTLALLEFIIRVFITILYGRYVNSDENEIKATKDDTKRKFTIYKKWKLWYWIPTFGIAIIFEYLTIWTIKIQNNKLYYSDLILFLILILTLALVLGVNSYDVRSTAIRRYS